jgi:hypothetical protein
VTANVQRGPGSVRVNNKIDGFGDLTVSPAKTKERASQRAPADQCADRQLPGGAPRQPRPQLLDLRPDLRQGFNALAHLGYAMNTENQHAALETEWNSGYRSSSRP